jgi:hypothetical protein
MGDFGFRTWLFVAIGLAGLAAGVGSGNLWLGASCALGAFGAMVMAARASGG